ncbi:putative odorant receptor 92a [Cimex lectularius]|uniref:Odorant receptor n=1 Tax=Cimex lectularius TaxID=79782 RepID=A0A8I6RNG7_CIMLE|nr:putative odorant receptor 92a [Cimex lectularius]
MEEVMSKSGLNMTLSYFSGFRGPLDIRFKEKWYSALYRLFSFYTDFLIIANTITIGVHFLSPSTPLAERCACGFPMLTSLHSSLRTFYFTFNRPRFAKLMTDYEKAFKGDPTEERLNAEIKSGADLFRPFPRILLTFMVAPMIPWCFIPLVSEFLGLPRVLTIPAWFPMDLTQRTFFSTFSFAVATMIQTLGATWVPMRVIAFDDVFYCYATRQLALFRHLSRNFEEIFESSHVSPQGFVTYTFSSGRVATKEEVKKEVSRKLRQWIIYHQKTIKLMKELQSLYSPALFVQFGLLCLILCFNAFYVALADVGLIQVIFCAFFVLGNAMELLVTCRIGDYIVIQSNKLTDGIAGKDYYLMAKPELAYLRMIMTRCQVPLSMSALGVFPLNTDTFQSIMVSAYSYFTMLKKLN